MTTGLTQFALPADASVIGSSKLAARTQATKQFGEGDGRMIRDVSPDAGFIPGPIDIYTYLMFAFLLVAIIAFFSIIIWFLGLPGKIAIERRHPHAETVKLMGWAGALAVVPWIHAFIWAYHDSMTIDIRRFPDAEKKAIDEEIAKLTQEDNAKTVEVDRPAPLPSPTPDA